MNRDWYNRGYNLARELYARTTDTRLKNKVSQIYEYSVGPREVFKHPTYHDISHRFYQMMGRELKRTYVAARRARYPRASKNRLTPAVPQNAEATLERAKKRWKGFYYLIRGEDVDSSSFRRGIHNYIKSIIKPKPKATRVTIEDDLRYYKEYVLSIPKIQESLPPMVGMFPLPSTIEEDFTGVEDRVYASSEEPIDEPMQIEQKREGDARSFDWG
jgi:hypothetical protein